MGLVRARVNNNRQLLSNRVPMENLVMLPEDKENEKGKGSQEAERERRKGRSLNLETQTTKEREHCEALWR